MKRTLGAIGIALSLVTVSAEAGDCVVGDQGRLLLGDSIAHRSIDIVPTILDWLGATVPRAMDGASLKPFLTGTRPEG